jgi:glycosyltransferase involved in cell wall biosynthesis
VKIAFIVRSTLYKVPGGITVQVLETAKHLRKLGIDVVVHLTNDKINYKEFDLLHFFDVFRPANILYHIKKAKKPFVITPVLLDYSEYDKQHRKGVSGFILRLFPADANEYIKTISRWLLGKDGLQSKNYLWKGQKKSIQHILEQTEMILPNSKTEYEILLKSYPVKKPSAVIPNGVDETLFKADHSVSKDDKLVICAAMIEGRKNQFNLIKALNNTHFRLVLIGESAPNQKSYYRLCRQIAAPNIEFAGRLSQKGLAEYYKRAKVHILPSWFETCGLSTLEAAAMGCNVIVTDKGFARDYFGDDAFYCNPGNAESIYESVCQAAESPSQKKLQQKILAHYTWTQTAHRALEAYERILSKNNGTNLFA